MAPLSRAANRNEPVFEMSVFDVRCDSEIAAQQIFDLVNSYAVLLAVISVVLIPIKNRGNGVTNNCRGMIVTNQLR
jgi:hypothetical protein